MSFYDGLQEEKVIPLSYKGGDHCFTVFDDVLVSS